MLSQWLSKDRKCLACLALDKQERDKTQQSKKDSRRECFGSGCRGTRRPRDAPPSVSTPGAGRRACLRPRARPAASRRSRLLPAWIRPRHGGVRSVSTRGAGRPIVGREGHGVRGWRSVRRRCLSRRASWSRVAATSHARAREAQRQGCWQSLLLHSGHRHSCRRDALRLLLPMAPH